MIAIEVIGVLVLLLVMARSRPPQRATSPRVLSALAGVALVAFGAALTAIVIVYSELVFAIAIGVAGIAAAAFLWLARAWPDEDEEEDDGDGDQPPETPDEGLGRFRRKRTGATPPRVPRG